MKINKLGIGTVQWGMEYGVSNLHGRTGHVEATNILAAARAVGVSLIDTATLYGESEKALGLQQIEGFRVVTKTPRFTKVQVTEDDAALLVETFERSLNLLQANQVYGLLIHHAEDVLVPGGEYRLDALLSLKERGVVQRIGVSIYDSRNLESLYERLKPDIVQLPLNVLDQRLVGDGSLSYLHDRGVEIHARSAFLQGLLLMPLSQVPDYFAPWRNALEEWHAECNRQGVSPLKAALSYVTSLDAVDYCILGFESAVQFQQCAVALSDSMAFDASGLACADANLVNPANWRLS